MPVPRFCGHWRSLTSRIKVVSCKAMRHIHLLTYLSKAINILWCTYSLHFFHFSCNMSEAVHTAKLGRWKQVETLRSTIGSLVVLAFCPLKAVSWYTSRASGWADLLVESMGRLKTTGNSDARDVPSICSSWGLLVCCSASRSTTKSP